MVQGRTLSGKRNRRIVLAGDYAHRAPTKLIDTAGMRPGLILAALALWPACTFDLGFEGTRYRCGEGERCPEGQTCVSGVCTVGVDANDADAIDGEAACGNLSLLRDTFDLAGDLPLWERFVDAGAALAETGGELIIDLPAGTNAYARYSSSFLYDLRGGALLVQVDEVAGADTLIEVRNHLGHAAQLLHQGGMMVAATTNHPGAGTHASAPRMAAEIHWRIREDAGALVWETSADRVSWRELHRRTLAFDVAHVRGLIAAGGVSASTSRARFEDVNLLGSAVGFCSTDGLVDDFAATPLDPIWNDYDAAGCTVVEMNGKLAMSFAGNNGNAFCGITSYHLWDLTAGKGVAIDGASFPRETSFAGYFQATAPRDGATRVELVVDGPDLEARGFLNGTPTGVPRAATFDRINQKFWRMSAVPGTAIFETAPTRSGPWTEFHRIDAPWDLTAIEINLGAGNYGPTPPVNVRVAGVNAD